MSFLDFAISQPIRPMIKFSILPTTVRGVEKRKYRVFKGREMVKQFPTREEAEKYAAEEAAKINMGEK